LVGRGKTITVWGRSRGRLLPEELERPDGKNTALSSFEALQKKGPFPQKNKRLRGVELLGREKLLGSTTKGG